MHLITRKKRADVRVDIAAESLTLAQLDPRNDDHVMGFHPLDHVSNLSSGSKLTSINFSKDDCLTDAVLHALATSKSIQFNGLKVIDLSACCYITDAGVKYVAEIVSKCPKLTTLNLSLLPLISHQAVRFLNETCPAKVNVSLDSSGVCYNIATSFRCSTISCPILNTKPDKAPLRGRLLIVRDCRLELGVTSLIVGESGESGRRSLAMMAATTGSITEVTDAHAWCDRLLCRPWPQIIIAFKAGLSLDEAKKFVFSTIVRVLSTQPPSLKAYDNTKFTILAVGPQDEACKSLNEVKALDSRHELGYGTVSSFIQKWQSDIRSCDQTAQAQYSMALKLMDTLDCLLAAYDKNVYYHACPVLADGMADSAVMQILHKHIRSNNDEDQKSRPYFYQQSDLTEKLLEAIHDAKSQCIVRARSLPGEGALRRAELGRLQDLCECLFVDVGDLPLVVTDVQWFLAALNEISQQQDVWNARLVPCTSTTKGCHQSSLCRIMTDKIDDIEVREGLQNILDFIGPMVKFGCDRTMLEQPLSVMIDPLNLKPPVPLANYYTEDRTSQKHLTSVRIAVHFVQPAPKSLFSNILATTSIFTRFESVWSDGYVAHHGAVEVIVCFKDGGKELQVEGLLMNPPDPSSHREKSYLKRHLWSVLNIHMDIIEFIMKTCQLLYRIDRLDFPTNFSICCHHTWDQPDQSASQLQKAITICTLCQSCTNTGRYCISDRLVTDQTTQSNRECGCQTRVTGCWDCGICRRCARLMWAIKSTVRPCQGKWQEFTFRQGNMFLVPVTFSVGFDEVTITSNMSSGPYLSLVNVEHRENIQVFPGLPKRPLKTAFEAVEASAFPSSLLWQQGDCLKIRLKFHLPSDQPVKKKLTENKLYNTHILRRMALWQKEGILCYTGAEDGAPVGLCASKHRMTRTFNKFRIKLLAGGELCAISIGIVPKFFSDDTQVGWREKSIGYHGDDGGFFLSAGSPRTAWNPWSVGDVIECGVDFNDDETKSVYFCHNGEKRYAITGTDRLPDVFHAAIGMHSPGEMVQLMSTDMWRAEEDVAMEASTFIDLDSIDVGEMSISPARCLTMDKTTIGWKDRKSSVIFIKNNSTSVKTVAVDVSVEDNFDVTLKKCGVVVTEPLLAPGEYLTALVLKGQKDASDSAFLVRWLDTDNTDAARTFHADKTTTDPKNTHRLRFEWAGGVSKANQGIQSIDSGEPEHDSHRLEIFKNGNLVTNYWIPKNSYHLQIVFPDVTPQQYREIAALVQMPKLPTFDLPEDFMPGMIVEMKSHISGEFEAGVIRTVKDDGNLMIEPKYQPDADRTNDLIEVHRTSLDIRPVAREFQNIRELMGLEPADLWHVAYGSLFTEEQLTEELRKNLWMYCVRRGSKCSTCSWLTTVQEKLLAYQTMEAFLVSMMTSLESTRLIIPFPVELTSASVSYPANMRIMDYHQMNLHPLCYPVRINQFRQGSLLCTGQKPASLVPHLLDHPGYKMAANATEHGRTIDDFIWRQSLGVAWCFVTMGTTAVILEPEFLLTRSIESDKTLVCAGIQKILYQYAAMTCLLTPDLSSRTSTMTSQDSPAAALHSACAEAFVCASAGGATDRCKLVEITSESVHECVCMAHYNAWDHESDVATWSYTRQLLQPYEKLMTVVEMNVGGLKALDDSMFENLINVEHLEISNGTELESIPASLDSCKKLHSLAISDTILTCVPKEVRFSQLSDLALVSCRLATVPEMICDMINLKTLDMSYNIISGLPPSFTKLCNLVALKLNGIPWFNDHGVSGSMITSDWYKTADHPRRQNRKILGPNVMDALFVKCDLDTNSCLDQSETPDLSGQLFYMVNRFGLDYEDGDEDGGFPMEICELPKLQTLQLANHAIRFIPCWIEKLTNLRSLSLTNNPLLEALPGNLYNLKEVKEIRLHQCPSLKTPPLEVVCRGTEAIYAYLKYLSADFTECRRTKLMLVGLGGAGKTSLLRALTSGQGRTRPTVVEDITDGINIGTWKIKAQDGAAITFSTWDFAGQTVYYNTHQFFLSKRAVYLLLWTTRLGFEHAGLEFWLSSICCHAPKTPIFIVGTHCDQVQKADIPVKELVQRYPQIAGFHFVSSVTGQGVDDLEKRLTEVALQQPYMGEQIPAAWLELEQKLIEQRKNSRVMPYTEVERCAMEVNIYVEKDAKQAVNFLHDLGAVQYFDSEFLRDHVVIDPQWIVDVMSAVVSVKDSPIKNGIFKHSDIAVVWKGEDPKLHGWLLRLTEKFDLTFPVADMDANIVPCLLPQNEPELVWPDIKDPNIRENKVIYKFTYLPAGLFNRAQVRLFEFSSSECLWKYGSLLKKNGHLALVRQYGDKELIVRVQGPQPQNVTFLIHEVFENLINESFHGVSYELFLPCPECVSEEGAREPDLLPVSLIQFALKKRAPYLQCRKYFHTVSMSELQAIVPPDSSSDFDAQMNRSIHLLRSLRHELSTDIFLSFSEKNVPTTNDAKRVTPDLVRFDLEKLGYRVWYPEEQRTAQELAISLNDSKLMLAFMSNEYEEDKTLVDLFLYCRNTLKKPFVIINYGDDTGWQKGDTIGGSLGMIIGAQEIYIHMTNAEMYNQKFSDLKKAIALKLDSIAEDSEHPVCFLSYCWANSLRACTNDGYRRNEAALGPVDPREMKNFLVENKISCWLDIEQVGQRGLFEDISEGIKGADFIIACISDEYTRSENCMMELRFAVYTLRKPVIFVTVGNNGELEPGEINMMMMRNSKSHYRVAMHEKKDDGFTRLLEIARQLKLDPALRKNERQKTASNHPQNKIRNIAFKEENELLQRKLLRQLSTVSSGNSVPYPRLVLLDLSDEITADEKKKPAANKADKKRHHTEAVNNGTVNDAAQNEDWRSMDMSFRILCESDQGWHCCGNEVTFSTTKLMRMSTVAEAASYLFRMYTVLKQSGVRLNCLKGDKGNKYMDYIHEHMSVGKEADDFNESYLTTLATVMKHDPGRTMGDLDRCYLPSGKIRWLCKKHQEGIRVTVLSRDVTVTSNTQTLVTEYDIIVRERILAHSQLAIPYMKQRNKTKTKGPMRPKSGTALMTSQAVGGQARPETISENRMTITRRSLQHNLSQSGPSRQQTSQACILQ